MGGEAHQGKPCVAEPVDAVLIISVDGLRPDALQRAQTPNLDLLWHNGAYTWRAQTTVPSVTLPSHASMLSGVGPQKHGVNWNTWDPRRGYIQVPTVFSRAKERGLGTAMFVGKPKLRHLARPGTVDKFDNSGYGAAEVGKAAAAYLSQQSPQMMFVHLPDPDEAGHRYGWMSPPQLEAIRRVDAVIGSLTSASRRQGQEEGLLTIVTADHGGHGREHGSADPLDTTIPWIAYGARVVRGHEIAQEVRTYDTAATALYALGLGGWEEMEGKPVKEAFTCEIRPARP